jgi:hypothetical protein
MIEGVFVQSLSHKLSMKKRKRAEERAIAEYDQLPSFPVVLAGRRLIPNDLSGRSQGTVWASAIYGECITGIIEFC